jgi:hypothetical protein
MWDLMFSELWLSGMWCPVLRWKFTALDERTDSIFKVEEWAKQKESDEATYSSVVFKIDD